MHGRRKSAAQQILNRGDGEWLLHGMNRIVGLLLKGMNLPPSRFKPNSILIEKLCCHESVELLRFVYVDVLTVSFDPTYVLQSALMLVVCKARELHWD